MSVLQRCPSYRESNKGSKERQGPTLGVRLIEVSVKKESTVYRAGAAELSTITSLNMVYINYISTHCTFIYLLLRLLKLLPTNYKPGSGNISENSTFGN